MNKKIIQLVIAAVALLMGSSAFAAASSATPDTNYPRVAPGETVVMEDQIVTAGAGTDLDVGDKVVLILPAGVNFSGTPTATATVSLKLQSNSAGDPGASGLVTLTDTDGDGGMDRAEVTVAVIAAATDTITFKGSITYSGTSTTGNLTPTVTVLDTSPAVDVFVLVDTDNVLATKVKAGTTAAPLTLQSTLASITVPNSTVATPVANPAQYLLTVPAGTNSSGLSGDETLTFTFGTGVRTDATSTLTFTALTDGAPAITTTTTIVDALAAVSADLAGATTRSSQYLVDLNVIETTMLTAPNAVTVTLSGDAGLAGSATVSNLASTGSTISLATGASATALTRTADAAQTLPTFEITEIFPTDFADGETITLVAPAGLTFTGAGATASSDGGAAIAANAVNGTGSEITITITTAGPGATAETLTVSGITATAGSTAAADINISAGKSIVGESANAPFTTLKVATASDVGAVTITGPTTAGKVGAGTTGNVGGTINLSEATYGAIATNSTFPFIQITPPAGITITGVVATPVNGAVFGAATAAVPADGTWVIPVTTESTAKTGATGPFHTIVITYSVGSTVASGTAVEFTLGGDVNVSGSVTIADVVDTTTSSVLTGSVIPDVESSLDFVAAGTLSVKELFAGALDVTLGRQFRVIAPSGITFASTQPAAAAPATALAVDTTFSANDTLLVTLTATGGTDTVNVTPNVFVSASADMGFNTFSVIDGNTNDTNGAGVTAGTADILYVGTVASPDAGADISVGEGFWVSQSVADGLADLTIASADTGTATATIEGSTFTVTGVSAGATVATVTDALGVTDGVAVTVVAGAAQAAVTTVASDGSTTDAQFSGGITTDNGVTFAADGAVAVGDEIQIVATIVPDSAHVGEAADIIVAIQDVATGDILLIDDVGALIPLGEDIPAFASIDELDASEPVNILGGSFTITEAEAGLAVNIFVGYALDGSDVIYYNSDPIPLVIAAE